MIEDREEQGLEDDALGERALDDQHGGAGEEDLALGIARDAAGEPVGREPLDRVLVDDFGTPEVVESGFVEGEVGERVEGPADPGHHAVPPALRKTSGE